MGALIPVDARDKLQLRPADRLSLYHIRLRKILKLIIYCQRIHFKENQSTYYNNFEQEIG
jgi:hypothetical protein